MPILTTQNDLDAAADELNKAIAAIEAAMKQRKFRVRVEVPVKEGHSLAWGKMDQQWHLIHVMPDAEEPLTSSQRWFRLDAIAFIDALVEAIGVATKEELDKTNRAIIKAQELAAKLAP